MDGAGGKFRGLRILIAEDDYLMARLVSDLVVGGGGTVVGPVPSGRKALSMIAETAIDGALLDIKLRDGNCFSLIDELTRRAVPVVLATGYPKSSIPARFQRLPFLIKPFDLRKLADCVAVCCRAARGEAGRNDGARYALPGALQPELAVAGLRSEDWLPARLTRLRRGRG